MCVCVCVCVFFNDFRPAVETSRLLQLGDCRSPEHPSDASSCSNPIRPHTVLPFLIRTCACQGPGPGGLVSRNINHLEFGSVLEIHVDLAREQHSPLKNETQHTSFLLATLQPLSGTTNPSSEVPKHISWPFLDFQSVSLKIQTGGARNHIQTPQPYKLHSAHKPSKRPSKPRSKTSTWSYCPNSPAS